MNIVALSNELSWKNIGMEGIHYIQRIIHPVKTYIITIGQRNVVKNELKEVYKTYPGIVTVFNIYTKRMNSNNEIEISY